MQEVQIGVLGLGTIGAELVYIIQSNAKRVEDEYGIRLSIKKVFVRDLTKKRNVDVTGLTLTNRIEDILEDEEISVIAECIGGNGSGQTLDYVKQALQKGKTVIMSSKKTLALYGPELLWMAKENQVMIQYDATVGGGIPIAKILENCFYGERVKKVSGIVNATSNFICSKMLEEKQDYHTALAQAQACGYAENDPSDDVDGYDALYKAVILSMFCFEKYFDPRKVMPKSIRVIGLFDMQVASELGYSIKPIFSIEDQGESLQYHVGPGLVKADSILGKINDNHNIIIVNGELTRHLAFFGQGAGKEPTASAMFDDILNALICQRKPMSGEGPIPAFEQLDERYTQYYMHLAVPDTLGVMAAVTKVLSDTGLNIDKLVTKDKVNDFYDVVVFTSKAEGSRVEEQLTKALEEVGVRLVTLLPILSS